MKKNKFHILIIVFITQFFGYSQSQYFPYRENESWGFCNEKAEVIEPAVFSSVERNWDSYDAFYIVTKENKKGVYFNSRLIIPAEYDNIKIHFKNIIIAEKKVNDTTIIQIFKSDGSLLIDKKIIFYNAYYGYDYKYVNFIMGFYFKTIDNKFSLVSVDFNNNNQMSYLISDVYSLELDKKTSKKKVDVFKIKKTEKSIEEKFYLKKSENAISLMEVTSEKEFLKNYSSDDYSSYLDEVVEEVPFEVVSKANIYRDYEINQNKIEVNYKNQSRFVKQNKKQEIVDFPFKATFTTQKLEYGGKEIISKDTTYLYPKVIVFKQKKKTGFFYKYPFQKGNLYDTLMHMKSVKKYHNVRENFFKVGLYDKKEKAMKFGVVDINQKVILPIQFQDVELGYNFHNYNEPNVFLVKKDNLYGLISEETKEVLPINFDFISTVNSNETFILVAKNKKYGALVKYYNGDERKSEFLSTYFDYKIKQIIFKNAPQKMYPKNVVEAIDYIVLEDENGNIKGYANPNGTLYFKD